MTDKNTRTLLAEHLAEALNLPARELSADDLSYICEQFEKLEF